MPVLLLAAIHFLLLDEPQHPLAAWYPNLTIEHRAPDDPALAETLAAFVHERSPAVLELLATRSVQTNEVGRCALFVPIFDEIQRTVGPLSHIDIGASAGLTTLISHYSYRYDDGPLLGTSDLVIDCTTRGTRTAPVALPTIRAARGLDATPIAAADPTEARWLTACCWPDQADRFERLTNALEIAQTHPPDVRSGDAVDDLDTMVELTDDDDAHPVITTSWVLNYLEVERQEAFVAAVDRVGRERDVTWVFAESPAQTPALDHAEDLAGEHTTALTSTSWRNGQRHVQHFGTAHPHGYWIQWR